MTGIVRTCLIALAGFIAAAVALFFHITDAGVQPRYAFWGATGASFCAVIAVNYLFAIFEAVRERTLLLRAAGGAPLRDGKWSVVNGPIRSRNPLRAPISGTECVAYEYRISREEQTTDGTRDVTCFEGKALAPSAIASRHGNVRLLAVPKLDLPMDRIAARDALKNAYAFIEATNFESSATPEHERTTMEKESTDDTGTFRKDRMIHSVPALGDCTFEERFIRQGETVCAFGRYDQTRTALVPHPNWAERARLLRGDARIGANMLRGQLKKNAVIAVVFALAAYGIVQLYTRFGASPS